MEKHFSVLQARKKQLARDIYYLRIAKTVSERSKCLSRKIGAVLVKDDSIVSAGFNGPAKGVKHCNERTIDFYKNLDYQFGNKHCYDVDEKKIDKCPRRIFNYKSGQGLHLCQAGHAERNALIQAARNGISTKDSTLYCWCGQICKDCAIEVVNAGIKELVYLEGPEKRTINPYDNYSGIILQESGIEIRTVDETLI
jgi:dCMP deaminase